MSANGRMAGEPSRVAWDSVENVAEKSDEPIEVSYLMEKTDELFPRCALGGFIVTRDGKACVEPDDLEDIARYYGEIYG